MNKYRKIAISFVTITFISFFSSCGDSIEIETPLQPETKTYRVDCGGMLNIKSISSDDWKIVSVKDIESGELILDTNNKPMAFSEGEVRSSDGWLIFRRVRDTEYMMQIMNNFDMLKERKVEICTSENGELSYINIIQETAGQYWLMNSEYEEIVEERKTYTSKDVYITLTNNSSEPVYKSIEPMYEDILNSSEIKSDDYGAFDWSKDGKYNLHLPDLIVDGIIVASGSAPYVEGVTTSPASGTNVITSLQIDPYSSLSLGGNVTLCKRVCKYTLTIRDYKSGKTFKVKGIWTISVTVSSASWIIE